MGINRRKKKSNNNKIQLNLKNIPRTGSRGVTQMFPWILKEIISHKSCHPYIKWSIDGDGFEIEDRKTFVEMVLHRIDKIRCNNWNSFQRQLNLYGFKMTNGYWKNKFFKKDNFHIENITRNGTQVSNSSNDIRLNSSEFELFDLLDSDILELLSE